MKALVTLALLALFPRAQAELLYYTHFDAFPEGDNEWHAFEGWTASDTTSGAQAIDSTPLNGLKAAVLGFNRPNRALTSVAKSLGYDPTVQNNPLISFAILFGVEDSTDETNYRRDDFFFSFYNSAGAPLASIRISNTDADYGFWYRTGSRSQGGREYDTGFDFVQGELYELVGEINFATNRWSAYLDGLPLFENAPFNESNQDLNLGFLAAEWEIGLGFPAAYGDNYLLVADVLIETVENPPPPVVITSIARVTSGGIGISWQASPGYQYQIEYSDNLETWETDLPDSTFAAPANLQTLQFIDASAGQVSERYYRVRQSPAK